VFDSIGMCYMAFEWIVPFLGSTAITKSELPPTETTRLPDERRS
jgi:hypothetical protein